MNRAPTQGQIVRSKGVSAATDSEQADEDVGGPGRAGTCEGRGYACLMLGTGGVSVACSVAIV